MFNLESFIKEKVINREKSLFEKDIQDNLAVLSKAILSKTVLVIGGAGSIGSSFIKAILPFKPKSLVVVDTNENGLAELTRDIRSTKGLFIPEDYITYPISYSDFVFEKMFRSRGGFNIVANFSAHKHVRSEKDIYSVEALLQNNVLHAQKLLDLLKVFPPERFFCVSTDKAANPVNIMGASKRIMEDLIFSYSEYFCVNTARFANVAFSNGSLPAGFIERFNKKQPISAPLDVKRYFVSPEESGQICMLACMLGRGREIFFPKLGEENMKTFSDIATDFLYAHGYDVLKCSSDEDAVSEAFKFNFTDKGYPVYFSKSDTTGEKTYEEFFTDQETVSFDRFLSLGVVTDVQRPNSKNLNCLLGSLRDIFNSENVSKHQIVEILQKYLPNFSHEEKNKFLDSKM